jgi:hypothetical protein
MAGGKLGFSGGRAYNPRADVGNRYAVERVNGVIKRRPVDRLRWRVVRIDDTGLRRVMYESTKKPDTLVVFHAAVQKAKAEGATVAELVLEPDRRHCRVVGKRGRASYELLLETATQPARPWWQEVTR